MIKKINYIFDKKQKKGLAYLLVLVVIGAFLELMGVTIILPFINAIMTPDKMMANPTVKKLCDVFGINSATQLILILVVCIIIIYIVKNLYLMLMYDIQYRFVYSNQHKLSNRMMKCYMDQPYTYHLTHNSADLIRNIMSDTMSFFSAVQGILQLITEMSVCIAIAVFLFITDKMITIGICALLIIFLLAFLRTLQKKIKYMGMESRKYNAAVNKCILQGLEGIKETKVMGREEYFENLFDENYKNFSECQRKYFVLSLFPKPITESVCIIGMMIIIGIKVYSGADVTQFVPTMAVFAMAAFRMLPSFNRITNSVSTIIFNWASVGALYEDIREIDQIYEKGKRVDTGNELNFKQKIEIKNVSFHYPDAETNVLQDITLEIPKNSSVGLIGASGQGKSTLVNIILGLLDPQAGAICVDGKDIRSASGAWHDKIGYIPQSIYLLDETIRSNVAYGISEDQIDDEKIWKALDDAQMKEFVQELENGLDTVVGERGTRLSGGQIQRIGIARALYHDPEVLIFDEATSALDSETERAVMNAVNQLLGTKTMIIIAHRLSTIKNCNYIYEIVDGDAKLVDKRTIFAE